MLFVIVMVPMHILGSLTAIRRFVKNASRLAFAEANVKCWRQGPKSSIIEERKK